MAENKRTTKPTNTPPQPRKPQTSKQGSREEYLRGLRDSVRANAGIKRDSISSIERESVLQGNSAKAVPTNADKQGNGSNRLLFLVFCLVAVATICTLVFSAIAIERLLNLKASRGEQASLLEVAETVETISRFDAEMRQINPDYICWLSIEDTAIDYPVVRGDDNEKYLHTSFYGEENVYGALFMDFRNRGEYVPNVIIYGHNSKTRDMFGGLRYFLDNEYMAGHPVITLKVNEQIVQYQVFSARRTDVTDPAYYLDFTSAGSFHDFAERCGAPPDTAQIVTLSTCVSGDDKDERVIVQGTLIADDTLKPASRP